MTFTVTLSAVSGKPVTVTYSLGGSATAGSDYTAPSPLSVSIPAGEASGSIVIPVKGDTVDELNETVEVTLTGATNASVSSVDGEDEGSGTITDDDATPTGASLSVDPGSVAEDATEAATVTVTATLAGSTTFSVDKTVTVTVGDKDDTAKSGTDYAAVDPFTITIAAGTRTGSATFDLNPTDDSLDEPTETLTVAGAAGGLTVSSASVEISDDDAEPSVSIADAAAVTEGDDPETTSDMTFTVSLSAISGKDVTVTYSLGGSATVGSDYTAPSPLSVSIPAGEVSGSITVPVKGDVVDESNETVEVTLVSATNATVSASEKVGEGTITDDDDTPKAAVVAVVGGSLSSVAENVVVAPTISFTVTLQGSMFDVDKDVTVVVGKKGDTAVSGTDYKAVASFTVTIPAGASSVVGSFVLDPTDDSLDEPDEILTISGLLDGVTISSTTVTITDDDDPPTVSIADATAVTEGDDSSATTNMTFTVSLSAVSGKPVTVTYSLGGSASAGSDYTKPNPLSVTIAAGSQTGSITIPVKGDVVDELNETVEVTLVSATNASVSTVEGEDEGSGTITDDDATPSSASLSVDPGSVAEEATEAATVTVTATLAGDTTFDTAKTVSVSVGKASDSAKSGTDYAAVDPFTVTIAAGASSGSASFDLDPTDDGLDEPTETVSVAGSATGLTVSSSSVSITDDDAAPSVSVGDATAVAEGDDSAKTTDMTFTVTLSAVSGKPVTVTYSLGGSASAGSDYTAPDPLSVSIPAGEASGSIVVAVKGDTVDELNETVEVTLTGATNATVSATEKVGEGTITDDDSTPTTAVLSVDPSSVAEDATQAATITMTATLAGSTTFSTDKTVTVTVGDKDDTAKSGTDYAAVDPFTITIAAGASSGSATFDLNPTNDGLDEPTETVSVSGSSTGLTVSGASVEITDDDVAPSVSVGDAAAVTEGDDPETTSDMTFTVTLSAVSGKPVTVTYSLGGSATAGSDYTAPDPLSVSIPEGSLTGSITIPVKGDTVDELNETVEVTLVSATNATVSATEKVGEGTITDDDATPTGASLSVAPSSVAEDASQAATITVTATLAGSTTFSTDKTVAVTVGAASDSAKSGTDYAAVEAFTITIAAGASSGSASFDLDPTDDLLDEPTETVSVSGSAGGLTVSSSSVSITDDDAAAHCVGG